MSRSKYTNGFAHAPYRSGEWRYRSGCQRHMPEHTHPTVRRAFELAARERASYVLLHERSGVSCKTIGDWTRGTMPSVANLDAVLNVLGYQLAVVPQRET